MCTNSPDYLMWYVIFFFFIFRGSTFIWRLLSKATVWYHSLNLPIETKKNLSSSHLLSKLLQISWQRAVVNLTTSASSEFLSIKAVNAVKAIFDLRTNFKADQKLSLGDKGKGEWTINTIISINTYITCIYIRVRGYKRESWENVRQSIRLSKYSGLRKGYGSNELIRHSPT